VKSKRVIEVLVHWYYVNKTFIKHFGIIKYLNSECYKHDLDKILPILTKRYDKSKHKSKTYHHIETLYSKYENIMRIGSMNLLQYEDLYEWLNKYFYEMLSDWESSRFSKAEKQLTGKEFWEYRRTKTKFSESFCSHVSTLLDNYKF
jgi:hypothetical protein